MAPHPCRKSPAAHFYSMTTFMTVLVVMAMVATVGVLFAGLVGLARGGENGRVSQGLMRWRVILQGVALALFTVLLLMMRG